MKELERIVFSYPKLKERIGGRKYEEDKVKKFLKEIRATYSSWIIKPIMLLLNLTISRLYDGIDFTSKDKLDLNKLCQENHVVLVPNHQSHADYMALNYIFYKTYKFPLYVAGGINLNIFLIGKLFRWCGCFFIRRSFANNVLYKLTLEAYLYYLLYKQRPIEFFFEGGRSRTGRLLPPKYGLYGMLLEAHNALPEENKKNLLFVPVSISHEHVPETKGMARELQGRRKKKESFLGFLKVLKIFSYQFGTVHIKLGDPVMAKDLLDDKKKIQGLAFDCFRAVGKNMLVTPVSLLVLILQDDPEGAMELGEIIARARRIAEFCRTFSIPISDSLKDEKIRSSMDRAIDLFIANRKINVIGGDHLGHVFYSIRKDLRLETLYFKNTILHHFLVPWIINLTWINIFNGSIKSVEELENMVLRQRAQLTHEFYLPTVDEFISDALKIISTALGREITTHSEFLNLSHGDFYRILSKLSVFSRCLTYIQETYYLSALALRSLLQRKISFRREEYVLKAHEIYKLEKKLGRVVKYTESFSRLGVRRAIDYFLHQGLIVERGIGLYSILDSKGLDQMINKYKKDLLDQFTFNMRVQ